MNLLEMLKYSINTIFVRCIGKDELNDNSIYYIGGTQILPPPLTNEEEDELLEKLSNGD